ncbi:MAG: pseudouridine-5'-phosphate glycosidase [Lachnospiraceae bacterium]|nr:pseudouridine-5'-phosphate glycosidase [Lachnospiraceae bacterium]
MLKYIDFSKEVKEALDNKKAVVAIETAGTFEGFGYPDNMKLANDVSTAIRNIGAVPAYIGIIDGRVKVGLENEEMERLAKPKEMLIKASRRDIPMLIAKKMDALTAVASTMMIAGITGIKVVTGGGIGGVHRGAETSFDISADLNEFTKSNVVVVCSGAKSILDLNLTMEYLETHAVSIAGYRTRELPAYMAVHSGIKLEYSFDTPSEVAEYMKIKQSLGVNDGLLLVNPIEEEYSVDSDKMNSAIELAVQKAAEDGIKGKRITKYILDIIHDELGGDSSEASIHLNLGNAVLAAEIACEIYDKSVM